jgi:hypothetical protein
MPVFIFFQPGQIANLLRSETSFSFAFAARLAAE